MFSASRPPSSTSTRGLGRFGVHVAIAAGGLALAAIPFMWLGNVVRRQGTSGNRIDLTVANSLHRIARESPIAVDVLQVASNVFAPVVFRVALGVTAVLLFQRSRRLSIWVLTTMLGELALALTLKPVFGRARPMFDDPVAHAGGQSFPSGHALGSMVACAVLVTVALPLVKRHHRRWVIAAGVFVVALVGLARIMLGVHFVTDVVGGWLVGAAWVALTTAAFESWRHDVGLRRSHPASEGIEPELSGERTASSSG